MGKGGNLQSGSASGKMVDYIPVAGPPTGLVGLGGPDGRIDAPGFTVGNGLWMLLRLRVIIGSALQAPPLVSFVDQVPFTFLATSKI